MEEIDETQSSGALLMHAINNPAEDDQDRARVINYVSQVIEGIKPLIE